MGLRIIRTGNRLARGSGGEVNNSIIGVPTDGSWADGKFLWDENDTVTDVIDDINEALKTLDISLLGINTKLQDIDTNTADISDIKDDIELLKEDNDTNKADISTLKEDVEALQESSAGSGDLVTLTHDVSVLKTDVASLQEELADLLEGSGGGGSDGTLGTPEDGLWTDGFFDSWSPTTMIKNAIDDISEAFLDLAPARAGVLTGASLVSSVATFYSGKLASGLDNSWYQGGKAAGDTISRYMVTHSIVLTTPNASTIFRSGKKNTPSSYGTITLKKNNTVIATYNLSAGIGGADGLNVTDISIYNSMWAKANANATLTLTDQGRLAYIITHSEAGSTNEFELWHDPSTGNLSFSTVPSAIVINPTFKYLSGKQYLTIGSTLSVDYIVAAGVFDKVYHSTNVSVISGIGFQNTTVNPFSTPSYSDTFTVSQQIILNSANQASNSPTITVAIYKPNTSISAQANITGYRICTYGTISTATSDDFLDENRRLVKETSTAFDSTVALANGEAQVRNGVLEYGATDYPTKTGPQQYSRKISKSASATGTITLTNLTYTNISPYGTGNTNVLLQLETENVFVDLGRAVGDKNGSGSGTSMENSIGGRVSGSGTTVSWSLGTHSTAYNNQEYRIIIIFRNNTNTITKLTST